MFCDTGNSNVKDTTGHESESMSWRSLVGHLGNNMDSEPTIVLDSDEDEMPELVGDDTEFAGQPYQQVMPRISSNKGPASIMSKVHEALVDGGFGNSLGKKRKLSGKKVLSQGSIERRRMFMATMALKSASYPNWESMPIADRLQVNPEGIGFFDSSSSTSFSENGRITVSSVVVMGKKQTIANCQNRFANIHDQK